MSIIDDALARQAARPAPRPIDYARMNRVHPKQKAALTRAKKAYWKAHDELDAHARFDAEPLREAREKVAQVCKAAVAEWNEIGAWPDDWSMWQVALDDTLGWAQHIDLRDL